MNIKNLAHIMLVRKYGFLGAAAIVVGEKVTNKITEAKEKIDTETPNQKKPKGKPVMKPNHRMPDIVSVRPHTESKSEPWGSEEYYSEDLRTYKRRIKPR